MIKYKLTEDGKGIMIDSAGLPVVFDDQDNKEFGLDAIHLYSKVPALQEEAKSHRLKAKEYNEKLSAFDDLDPTKALEAMQLTANLSAGDLTKKEEVERIKKETEDAWKGKFEGERNLRLQAVQDMQKKLDESDNGLRKSLLTSQFSRSPHFTGKEPTTVLTPEIAEAYFGKHFKIEKAENGNRMVSGFLGENLIYSKKRPGEPADFDEAMEEILNKYPMKDAIMQKSHGTGAGGSGSFSRAQTIARGDQKAFGDNLEAIASGKIVVSS
jgi:hypothetical protein